MQEILLRLWEPTSPQNVLVIGCGSGIIPEWFDKLGHQTTGIDSSGEVLESVRKRLAPGIALDRGVAEHLPYDDNTFDTVALIASLEFTDDPKLALAEALRVARRNVLIGTLNKFSPVTWPHYFTRMMECARFGRARFFSVFELQNYIEEALGGPIPLRWRTGLLFPPSLRVSRLVEHIPFVRYQPFGHVIGMSVDVRYRFQTLTTPLFVDPAQGISHIPFHTSCRRSPINSPPTPKSPQSEDI